MIEFYRKQRNLTQKEFGKKVNLAQSTISKFEKAESMMSPLATPNYYRVKEYIAKQKRHEMKVAMYKKQQEKKKTSFFQFLLELWRK